MQSDSEVGVKGGAKSNQSQVVSSNGSSRYSACHNVLTCMILYVAQKTFVLPSTQTSILSQQKTSALPNSRVKSHLSCLNAVLKSPSPNCHYITMFNSQNVGHAKNDQKIVEEICQDLRIYPNASHGRSQCSGIGPTASKTTESAKSVRDTSSLLFL